MAKIVIDPGHYAGYNKGVCPNYNEGDTMLSLAKFLGSELSRMGANVVYTRTTGTQNPSLADRGRLAAGADLFISLHTDASDNPAVRGVTVYRSVRQPKSETFANQLGQAVANVMGNQFRGTEARESGTTPGSDYYGVLRSAVAAGAKNALLVEHGFHTNMQDCLFLSNTDNLKRIATAEAQVIAKNLGLTRTSAAESGPSSLDPNFILNAPGVPNIPSPNATKMPNTTSMQNSGMPNTNMPNTNMQGTGMPNTNMQGTGMPNTSMQNSNMPNTTTQNNMSGVNNNMQKPENQNNANTPGARPAPAPTPRPMPTPFPFIPEEEMPNIPNVPSPQNMACPLCDCRFIYRVQPTDSLYIIGHKFGVPWQDIAESNNLVEPFRITPGDRLIIPLPTE